MNIILHLGGNPARAITAAALAKTIPESMVVVSSEGDESDILPYYEKTGISLQRLIVDHAAWDTVTNFTHTYKLLRSLNCQRLYVVTSLFHCYRATLVALACWGLRVPVVVVPADHETIAKHDEALALVDAARAFLWRLTGVLLFSRKIREERQAMHTNRQQHARWEIGV